MEVTETETAKFETEISEDDVHGNWQLKGEALHQSAVSGLQTSALLTLFSHLSFLYPQFRIDTFLLVCLQDVEMKEEATRHMLVLYNVRMDMAGAVDFSAANARSSAQLRVKGFIPLIVPFIQTLVFTLQQMHEAPLTMFSSASLCLARSIGLVRPLKDVMVTAGETATFECELSYEGIAVEWFLGGQKMEASERVSRWPAPPVFIATTFPLVWTFWIENG